MTQYIIKKASELSAENSVYRLQGISGTGVANSTTNIDWPFPEERWITGGMLSLKNPHWGDTVDLCVVYKAGEVEQVVNTFVDNFKVREDSQLQCDVQVPYVSLIPQGLYIRISYTNTHAIQDTEVILNLFSHIPSDIAHPSSP